MFKTLLFEIKNSLAGEFFHRRPESVVKVGRNDSPGQTRNNSEGSAEPRGRFTLHLEAKHICGWISSPAHSKSVEKYHQRRSWAERPHVRLDTWSRKLCMKFILGAK